MIKVLNQVKKNIKRNYILMEDYVENSNVNDNDEEENATPECVQQ